MLTTSLPPIHDASRGHFRLAGVTAAIPAAFLQIAACSGRETPAQPAARVDPLQAAYFQLLEGGGGGGGPSGSDSDFVSPTDVLLEFSAAIPTSHFFASAGLNLLASYPEILMVKVSSQSSTPAAQLAGTLLNLPGVVAAEPDRGVVIPESRSVSVAFNDGSMTHSDYVNQTLLEQMNVAPAHAIATGAGMTVAIIDTGIDPAHPALVAYTGGDDLIGADSDPSEERYGFDVDGDGLVDEAYGHGTHVAGVVALLAPSASLRAYRVLDAEGRGMGSDVTAAVLAAVRDGAQVINLSLGMYSPLRALEKAVEHADTQGVAVAASIGNSGAATLEYPSAFPTAVAVGSCDAWDTFSSFSNYGAHLQASAPGEGILSAFPGGGYATWSGTSMSTPMVSALFAVTLSASTPTARVIVRSTVVSTGDPVSSVPGGWPCKRVDFEAAVSSVTARGPLSQRAQ